MKKLLLYRLKTRCLRKGPLQRTYQLQLQFSSLKYFQYFIEEFSYYYCLFFFILIKNISPQN